MTQKDRELLFKDLSARLPYNVIVRIHDINVTDYDNYLYEDTLAKFRSNDIIIKPYLRPISSMTMEEDRKRINLGIWKSNQYDGQIIGILQDVAYANPLNFQSALIWLLQNHFDIFGLIPKGLAIAVNEENNPYSTKEKQI